MQDHVSDENHLVHMVHHADDLAEETVVDLDEEKEDLDQETQEKEDLDQETQEREDLAQEMQQDEEEIAEGQVVLPAELVEQEHDEEDQVIVEDRNEKENIIKKLPS